MKKILLVAFASVTTIAFAQNTRNLGNYSMLKVYDRITVDLIPAQEEKVEISSGNLDDVETINKNGELKIRMSPAKVLQGSSTKVKVYYTNLSDIQASQGSVIKSNATVESKLLNVTANEGSEVDLSVETQKLVAKGNSGGKLKIDGKADSQDIIMNSGALFYGKNVKSGLASVTVNAGGFAEVYSDDTVETTTRAGGTIEVYGDPETRNSKKVIGGKVIFK